MSELIGYLSEVEHLKGELTIPKVVGGGGGDTPVIESLSVTPTTSQQTYNDSEVDGYKPVVVNPIPSEYIVPTGTKNITQNGTGIDVAAFASANVNVPNSYSASDEGKVVDNGALVVQTAHADVTPTTSDQTIDTTTNNSIKVKGDADLVAANIKKDIEIFGVTGSYEGGGAGAVTQDQNGFLVLSPDAGGGGGGITGKDITLASDVSGVGNSVAAIIDAAYTVSGSHSYVGIAKTIASKSVGYLVNSFFVATNGTKTGTAYNGYGGYIRNAQNGTSWGSQAYTTGGTGYVKSGDSYTVYELPYPDL